ncbi:hypothetical protein HZB02_07770 [Candidatus Woesearchaeota archaeon]|nr:hypothetical protein [Candidatus Woesearchaeota archaeon]
MFEAYARAIKEEDDSLYDKRSRGLISAEEYTQRFREGRDLLKLVQEGTGSGGRDTNFYRIAHEFNLEWGHHTDTSWGDIEKLATRLYHKYYFEGQFLAKQEIEYEKRKIKEYASFLLERKKRLTSPKEREAQVRIAVILGKLYKGLVKKYDAQRKGERFIHA